MNSKLEKLAIPRADTVPADGYVLSLDGKLKAKFEVTSASLHQTLRHLCV